MPTRVVPGSRLRRWALLCSLKAKYTVNSLLRSCCGGCLATGRNHFWLPEDDPCCIMPGLYLGSWDTEADLEALKDRGVTHILQVGAELSATFPDRLTYAQIPIIDAEEVDIISVLPDCFAFIEEGMKQGGVLVHCAAGVSRSATVVIAFLMWKYGRSLAEALWTVRAARPRIRPNAGFAMQLSLFEYMQCDPASWPGWNFNRRRRSPASLRAIRSPSQNPPADPPAAPETTRTPSADSTDSLLHDVVDSALDSSDRSTLLSRGSVSVHPTGVPADGSWAEENSDEEAETPMHFQPPPRGGIFSSIVGQGGRAYQQAHSSDPEHSGRIGLPPRSATDPGAPLEAVRSPRRSYDTEPATPPPTHQRSKSRDGLALLRAPSREMPPSTDTSSSEAAPPARTDGRPPLPELQAPRAFPAATGSSTPGLESPAGRPQSPASFPAPAVSPASFPTPATSPTGFPAPAASPAWDPAPEAHLPGRTSAYPSQSNELPTTSKVYGREPGTDAQAAQSAPGITMHAGDWVVVPPERRDTLQPLPPTSLARPSPRPSLSPRQASSDLGDDPFTV